MPVAIGLVDLGVLLGLIVLIGISWTYRYTLGATIVALVNLLNAVKLPGILGGGRIFGFVSDELTKVDNSIRHALGVAIETMQHEWNKCISYTAQAVHWIGQEIADLAYDTSAAVEGLATRQVKPYFSKRLAGILATVAALKAEVSALKHTAVTHVIRETKVIEHKVTVIEHSVAVPHSIAIPRTLPRVGQLEREADAALARIRGIARRFGPAALVGTVAYALSKLGLGWVRCSKVSKAGKQLCGMNDSLLESLLADTLLIVGTVSLVEMVRELEPVMKEAASLTAKFWRAT